MSNKQPVLNSAEPIFSQYLNARAAAMGIPLSGHFELTNRCNFNCKMCYVHDNARQEGLSAAQWIDIGKSAVERGMVYLLLTGGEPILRSDFPEIYLGLQRLGLLISVNTNGSLISSEILELYEKNPPMRVNVSLYGGCEETYKKFCGSASFQRVVSNIRKLRERGISVKVNCSVTPDNEGDIHQIYQICRELEVPIQATSYMFPPVRINGCKSGEAPARFTAEAAASAYLLCQEQVMTPEEILKSRGQDGDQEEKCTGAAPSPMHCRAGKTAFWVTWDGRMIPCGMMPVSGIPILETGFDRAWEDTRSYCKTLFEPAQCGQCPKRSQCPACVASCIAETGSSMVRPEYVCRMVHHLDRLKVEKYGKGETENETKS